MQRNTTYRTAFALDLLRDNQTLPPMREPLRAPEPPEPLAAAMRITDAPSFIRHSNAPFATDAILRSERRKAS